jgi:hypothetical protein
LSIFETLAKGEETNEERETIKRFI